MSGRRGINVNIAGYMCELCVPDYSSGEVKEIREFLLKYVQLASEVTYSMGNDIDTTYLDVMHSDIKEGLELMEWDLIDEENDKVSAAMQDIFGEEL